MLGHQMQMPRLHSQAQPLLLFDLSNAPRRHRIHKIPWHTRHRHGLLVLEVDPLGRQQTQTNDAIAVFQKVQGKYRPSPDAVFPEQQHCHCSIFCHLEEYVSHRVTGDSSDPPRVLRRAFDALASMFSSSSRSGVVSQSFLK